EGSDLAFSEVENVALPVRMVSLLRVSILKKMRAVIVREAVGVRRKMRRDPVENYSESSPVKFIDEMHEIFGYAKSACRSKVPEGLVAPRSRVRVLHYREEFDVGETHLFKIAR